MSRLADAVRRAGVRRPEIVITAVLVLVSFVDIVTAPADQLGNHAWFVILGTTIAPLPLLFMRRHAVAAFCGVVGTELAVHLLGTDVTMLFAPMLVIPVAAYATGAYVDAPRTYWLGASVPAVVALVNLTSPDTASSSDYIFPSLIFLAGWFVGRLVHGRAQVARRLEEQAALLEQEREELAQAAVARERARIARELHDVVAHSVSAMVIQAGAARRVLTRSPEESAAALRTVQSVGREALGELRRTLGFLRPEAAAPELQPAPSIARVDELANRARAAGLQLELRVEGEPGPLSSSTDLAAYRIVQEALTNTLKHAGHGHALVLIRWDPDAVVIEVRDTGQSAPAGADAAIPSAGQGLIGMRERAALAGGDLEAGPVRDGGFRVRARLPRASPPGPPRVPSTPTTPQEAQTA